MQIVIDIPNEAYNRLLEEQHLPNEIDLEYFIIHGKPLPEKHGNLVDFSDIKIDVIDEGLLDKKVKISAHTIIEATEEQE